MFYCTKLDWSARQILTAYSYHWAIECAFENCKQLLGLEDPANQLPKAVERTAPIALMLYSLVIVWFHQTRYQFVRFPDCPWYCRKQEPSFADLLTTLRRITLHEKTREVLPNQRRGTDHQNAVTLDQQDGSAPGDRTGRDVIGAYAGITRHVAKSAESIRTWNLAWQSWVRTGQPGVRAC
jgi:hypothetical protein